MPTLAPKKVRFVLTQKAVNGLRESDRILHELFLMGEQNNWPGKLTREIAAAYIHTQHAVEEINRCNVETDDTPEEEA